MTDEQLKVVQIQATCLRKYWTDKKNAAYAKLIELAELEADDMCDEEQKNAELAFETVHRYGSCKDKAQAVTLYVTYSGTKMLLEG